ncbi:hypothetical protein V6N13_053975 [Hibiscus sabdariffa]
MNAKGDITDANNERHMMQCFLSYTLNSKCRLINSAYYLMPETEFSAKHTMQEEPMDRIEIRGQSSKLEIPHCPQCVAWQLVTLCCSGFSVCLNPYVNVVRLDSLSSYSPGGVSIKGFGLRSKAFEAFSLNS